MITQAPIFGLSLRDMNTCTAIFKQYPIVHLVQIFGSRAKGTNKPYSDIDLAIMTPNIDQKTLSKMKAAFDESSLPYKVDLVYYPTVQGTDLAGHIDRVGKLFYDATLS